MKKRLLVTSIVLLSLTLAACGNKEKDGTSESTAESSKTVETKSSTKEDQAEGETATFKGKIGEIPVLDELVYTLLLSKQSKILIN
jgi:ABC-type glycerol-3-phosphate transport system substrate-binding protein